jgi:hypothetical protein
MVSNVKVLNIKLYKLYLLTLETGHVHVLSFNELFGRITRLLTDLTVYMSNTTGAL